MSVGNPETIDRPRSIMPGDKVLIFVSSLNELLQDYLFIEFEGTKPATEEIVEVYQGIVKTIPEQFVGPKVFWEIKSVECLNHMGAFTRCANLSFENDEERILVSRIPQEPLSNQYCLRVDPDGSLQL